MTQKKDHDLLMKEFLEEQTIVIADNSSASRTRLKKSLLDLGAKQHNIKSCSTFEEAKMIMQKHSPRIVISEYMLGKKSGFDLLREHRETFEQSKKSLFILITANGNQSLVARAAEEDIDSFILKPYTADSLKKILVKTAMDKLYPSPYAIKIEEGKIQLFEGEFETAKELFKEAIKLSKQPTLALFYLGQAEAMQEALEEAKEKYEEGLSYNKIHYKCLVSLFDLLHEQEKYVEAYQVVRRIAKYFPANPQRLGTVLRLAIKTENVTDIPEYYEPFKSIDERPEYLIKNMSAGLIICGKYYLSKKKATEGIKLFDQAAIISKENPRFLLYIIEFLIFYGELNDINRFIKRFRGNNQKSAEFQMATFLAKTIQMPPQAIIREAMDLIRQGLHTVGIYYVLIQNLTQEHRISEALTYCLEVEKRWPEKQYFFDSIKNRHPQLISDAS